MIIIIGRDAASSGLNIRMDNNAQVVGPMGIVPKSVSRQHCELTISDDGTLRIRNLNPQNVTYVNGVAVISKAITRNDKVELGTERYHLNWNLINKVLPKEVDIRPLKEAWNTYSNDIRAVALSTQRFQVIRGVVPVFTMSAVLISYISGGRGKVFCYIYALVIVLGIFFMLKAWKDIARNEERRKDITDRFTHDYCCPDCGFFFGYTDYRILVKNYDNCPKCKKKLRK